VGIAVSLLGVAIIGLVKDREIQLEPRALLVLLAALAQSLYFVWQKPYLKKYGAFNYATYAVLAGTFFLLVFTPGLLRDVGGATRQATWAVIYMGVFPGAIGYASWSFVLSRMPASVAGSFLYLVPAVAAFIAWVWLGEVLTLIALFGGALVIGGVLLVNLLGKRQG
jgi:drug/metabolite transporter (DMT)-like permease